MNETTAMTVTNEQALAMLNDMDLTPRGFEENVRAEDVAQPPRLRIAQRASDEAPEGVLYNSLTGKVYGETVEAIFLMWETDTAVKWPEKYDKDNDPMCASDNGRMPSVSTERRPLTDPMPGPCNNCPSSKFNSDGERPRCSRQRNCIVWLVDEESPIRLTLQVSSLPSGKTLTNLSKTCNVRKSIYITTKLEDNDKGRYYIYLFTEGNKQHPVLSYELKQLADALKLNISADEDAGYVPDEGAQVINGHAAQVDEQEELPF